MYYLKPRVRFPASRILCGELLVSIATLVNNTTNSISNLGLSGGYFLGKTQVSRGWIVVDVKNH